ncbi:MAG: cytochrome P450 [Acidimicrobiales bacterium]
MGISSEPQERLSVDEIDLSDIGGFWALPLAEREGAFVTLRRERPVAFFEEPELMGLQRGPGYWAVTRYADVVEASRRPDVFCSGLGATTMIDLPVAFREYFGGMINADDPRHARLRRIVSRAFTPKRLSALAGEVARVTGEILDAVCEKGECDFATDVAAPLPLRVTCDLMGIPASEQAFVLEKTNLLIGVTDPELIAEDADLLSAVLSAGIELGELVRELGRARREEPTSDVISALVNAELDGETLSFDELASAFILLVVAGNETTRNAINWGLVNLCEQPGQRAAWEADFEALAGRAVEEIVRWSTPVIQMRRTLTCDAMLGGRQLRKGEKVLLFYNSANRDEEAFDAPYSFEVGRADNRHLGFGGYGPHYCLGVHLARLEVTSMFRELFRRVPDIQPSAEPERLRSHFINGIKHLPCEFTPSER